MRTFLDTYDWRVYGAGMVAEQEAVNGANGFDALRLWSSDGHRCEAVAEVAEPVRFAQDLPRGYPRALLEPILAMRALLPLASLRVEAHTWEVINLDENAVLRLIMEDARVPGSRGGVRSFIVKNQHFCR